LFAGVTCGKMFWFLPLLAVPTIREEVASIMDYGFSHSPFANTTTTPAPIVDILPPFDFLPQKDSPEAVNYTLGGKVGFKF
jgi:hypothetical protein